MFKKLKEYYTYIENDRGLSYDYNLTKALVSLRDKYRRADYKSKCSYELFFNEFSVEKNELKPKISYADGSEYPNLDLFDDELSYIKVRAKNVNNPRYRAKYNHLLWLSKNRHFDYVKEAVNSYLSHLRGLVLVADDVLMNRAYLQSFENLFILCRTVNYQLAQSLSLAAEMVVSEDMHGYTKYCLMKFIVLEKKKTDNSLYDHFYTYANNVIENNLFPQFRKEYLKLLVLLSKKLRKPQEVLHNQLGDLYMIESERHSESFAVNDY